MDVFVGVTKICQPIKLQSY